MSTLTLKGATSGSSVLKAPDSGSNEVTFTMPASTGTLLTTTGSGANLTGLSSFDPDGAVTINDTGADVDFRVEGDNKVNALFVQGSNSYVGIGSGAPVRPLTIDTQTGTTSLGGDAEVIKIAGSDADETYCGIGFHYDNSDGQTHSPAFMGYQAKNWAGSTNGDLVFGTRSATSDSAPTERMRIDSAGNVGIGESTMQANLHVKKGDSGAAVHSSAALYVENNGDSIIQIGSPADAQGRILFSDPGDANIGQIIYDHTNNYMGFRVADAELVRINENASYGKTMIEIGQNFVGGDGVYEGVLSIVADVGNGQQGIAIRNDNTHSSGGGHKFIHFENSSAGNAGEISHTASTTVNYSTSSDYRLKENQVAISDGIDRVKQLKPYRFNWKAEPDRIVDGFFAHEVQGIVDEAITGTKDAMETRTNCVLSSDGTMIVSGVTEALWTEGKADETYPSDSTWEASKDFIKAQNIDQSKLVPLLTGALQEAVAKIEELTTRIETLEAE